MFKTGNDLMACNISAGADETGDAMQAQMDNCIAKVMTALGEAGLSYNKLPGVAYHRIALPSHALLKC